MNEQPLVTIIVPAYCHEKYISDCLKSIYEQTYDNIEVIVCDDCSTDRTFKVIQAEEIYLKKRFEHVTIYSNEKNQGVVKNINSMVKKCRGKYIKLIASDDILLNSAIDDLVDYCEQYPEYDFVFSNALVCGEHVSYPVNQEVYKKYAYSKLPDLSGNLLQKLYEYNFIQAPTGFFRADTFRKYGLFDEDLSIEDWEYWLRLALRGKIGYCDSITVAYRVVGQSLSHFNNTEDGRRRLRNMYQNQMMILDKYSSAVGISACKGYQNVIISTMHEAIDIQDEQLQKELWKDVSRYKVKMDKEIVLKYICYKMHVLTVIRSIKRKLGMETVDPYKNRVNENGSQ